MKLLLFFIIGCTLVAAIIAVEEKRTPVRATREADDEDDVDDEELKAALARKPKITRPAFAKPPPISTTTTTTTPAPVQPKTVSYQNAQPASAFEPRSLELPRVLPARLDITERSSKADSRFSGTKGGSSGAKRGQFKSPGNSVKSGSWGYNAPSYSPIAKGKSMYRPRSQVPYVEAPVPTADLLVPFAPENRASKRVNSIQEKVYSVVAPVQQNYRPQVQNTLQEKVPSVVVTPIARGSRPRTGVKSSRFVDDYQMRADLNPSYQSMPLPRAAVSEDQYEECPYGMRLSVCRKRAAERLQNEN